MQQLFNKAVTAVLAQGQQSLTKNAYMCAYRGADGCKCAVGHLIDDEHYDPGLEGETMSSDVIFEAVLQSNPDLPPTTNSWTLRSMLMELQRAHDNCGTNRFVEQFRHHATEVAERYNLEMPDA